MSSGLRESKRRAKRQRRRRVFKYGFMLVLLGAFGVSLYGTGRQLSQWELRDAQAEIVRLKANVTRLEQDNASLRAAVETARLERAQLQERYDTDVPTGQAKALYEMVRNQLSQGAKADRLRFLISAAAERQKCDGEPVTKRFLVKTPLYDGAASTVTFADSTLTVTATGQSAESAGGQVQAWYDPTKPVTVEISRLGESPKRVSGKLPIQHALVANKHEYRFSIVPGDRQGFANVTVDRCSFP